MVSRPSSVASAAVSDVEQDVSIRVPFWDVGERLDCGSESPRFSQRNAQEHTRNRLVILHHVCVGAILIQPSPQCCHTLLVIAPDSSRDTATELGIDGGVFLLSHHLEFVCDALARKLYLSVEEFFDVLVHRPQLND